MTAAATTNQTNLLTATSTQAIGQGLHAASVPGQLRVAVAKRLLTLALCCLSMRRAAQSCARPAQPISSVHRRADDSSSDDESN